MHMRRCVRTNKMFISIAFVSSTFGDTVLLMSGTKSRAHNKSKLIIRQYTSVRREIDVWENDDEYGERSITVEMFGLPLPHHVGKECAVPAAPNTA